MRDTLSGLSSSTECGIVSLNTCNQSGSYWACYYRNKRDRIYFYSSGQIPLLEIQRYLKTSGEFDHHSEVIQRNTDIVQAANTSVCGHLCLFILKSLERRTVSNDSKSHAALWWIYIKLRSLYLKQFPLYGD